ncbi:MAG: ATP-binding protein [Akkermansia sp.]|nr:ATP-binding protein [Akkermansia sp.]
MKLKSLIIKNFRSYKGEHRISFSDITTIIGKNDAGKSTLLDALGIFFEHPLLKNFGYSDYCVDASDEELIIGCEFEELPEKLIIDTSAETTLDNEYLLNSNNNLEILRVYTNKGESLSNAKIYVRAMHPSHEDCNNLLCLKISDLKKVANQHNITPPDNSTIKSQWRHIIWNHFANDLNIIDRILPLDKEDGKSIYDALKDYFPIFALFRADRSSSDEDSEAQDPLKIAILSAINEVQDELETIKNKVQEKALEVANATLSKLHDFDSSLAAELRPEFKSEPKWDSLFKLTLKNDNNISINKRGSGVRRLVLFSFFRAEVERISKANSQRNIIYAIEEPETAQHPDMQHTVIETLSSMSYSPNTQIILTTHVPQLASFVPIDSIRFVSTNDNGEKSVTEGDKMKFNMLEEIVNDLGILPSLGARVAVCVEGKHDIDFLLNINTLLINAGYDIVNLSKEKSVALIGMGGSSLKDWVDRQYLLNFGIPEIHIYDSDSGSDKQLQYADYAKKINQRTDGSRAFLTKKREMENYIHPEAIKIAYDTLYHTECCIEIDDTTDVEAYICENIGKPKKRQIKEFLNKECTKYLTVEMLKEINAFEEIMEWFLYISKIARLAPHCPY